VISPHRTARNALPHGHQIRSGVAWTDARFDVCVQLLLWPAALFGVSNHEGNVWIFCVIWTLPTLGLLATLLWNWRLNSGLRVYKTL
jgi:hypothetical protein